MDKDIYKVSKLLPLLTITNKKQKKKETLQYSPNNFAQSADPFSHAINNGVLPVLLAKSKSHRLISVGGANVLRSPSWRAALELPGGQFSSNNSIISGLPFSAAKKIGVCHSPLSSQPFTLAFAFNNKVFDFSIKIENGNINDYIRPIKPTDYILTTTGYDFPDILAEDNLEHEVFLNKCLKDVYINDDKLDYILDTFATTLNGGNIEQNFNIHTGSGSNCKSSIMDLMSKVFGKYSQNIEPACFTQPKVKGAHDTFYLIKGKRWVRVEEPDSVNGNKLQSATLKIFADDKGGKIKGREI